MCKKKTRIKQQVVRNRLLRALGEERTDALGLLQEYSSDQCYPRAENVHTEDLLAVYLIDLTYNTSHTCYKATAEFCKLRDIKLIIDENSTVTSSRVTEYEISLHVAVGWNEIDDRVFVLKFIFYQISLLYILLSVSFLVVL